MHSVFVFLSELLLSFMVFLQEPVRVPHFKDLLKKSFVFLGVPVEWQRGARLFLEGKFACGLLMDQSEFFGGGPVRLLRREFGRTFPSSLRTFLHIPGQETL